MRILKPKMAFCDFVVKHNPAQESGEELTKKILYSIIIKRLKANKPTICFCGGDSGEGKSMSMLRLQELLLEVQGLRLSDYMNAINVFTPLQYPEKLNRLLFDKDLKKVNIICMHEAREIVKAKMWYSFLNQSVSDVNAMSRSIKRMCIMVISQFIRDISNDIRYTLNYYMKVSRPKGKSARLYINVMWKDDRDLEKPKLRKRKLSGYIILPNGTYKRFIPKYLEMKLPPKEIVESFEKMDYDAKAGIIKSKMDKMIKEMKKEVGEENKKVDSMVDWYTGHTDSLNMIGRRIKGKWKVKGEIKQMHDLNPNEVMDFETKLNEKLKLMGHIEGGEKTDG